MQTHKKAPRIPQETPFQKARMHITRKTISNSQSLFTGARQFLGQSDNNDRRIGDVQTNNDDSQKKERDKN